MVKLAKLDDDGNLIPESTVDVVTIKVDGQDVEVPQSAAAILEKADRDLHSRNERILREERETTRRLLDEDTQWFNTHSNELWAQYEPKVNGGKGFTGDPTMTVQSKEVPKLEITQPVDDAKYRTLEEKLKKTEEKLDTVMAHIGKTGEEKVIEVRDTLLHRYPNADKDAVNDGLRNFFNANGRHPMVSEIEAITKARHDFVTSKIEASKTLLPSTTVIPPVGGGTPPSISKTKTPRMDDIEAWKDLAHADNVSSG